MLLVGYLFIPVKKQKERTLNFSKNKRKSLSSEQDVSVTLNVFFNYNGHSFDAYEVLGVPAGSTSEEVHSAFQKSLQGHDAGSQELFQLAFAAIQQTRNK